jgi:hypothetical protein
MPFEQYSVCVQVGVHVALEMYEQLQAQWKSTHDDSVEGFQEWFDAVEPQYPEDEPMLYGITIGDQLEYARMTADAVDADQVDNAKYLQTQGGSHDEQHVKQDLGQLLQRFLLRFNPRFFDHSTQVISFSSRMCVSLEEFNESRDLPVKYSGTGIMVEDPQSKVCQDEACLSSCRVVQSLVTLSGIWVCRKLSSLAKA